MALWWAEETGVDLTRKGYKEPVGHYTLETNRRSV